MSLYLRMVVQTEFGEGLSDVVIVVLPEDLLDPERTKRPDGLQDSVEAQVLTGFQHAYRQAVGK